jgi:hypothetical protein
MHYHAEIILPPTDEVEKAIEEIMTPYSEHEEDNEYYAQAFWDFYIIGGRWAGAHLQSLVDPNKLQKFYDELDKRNVTVSGLQCGKQELQPADQIPMVDELWCEMFPESELKACPLFKHFNNQYVHNCLDVDTFDKITEHLIACRVIVAGLDYKEEKYEAKFMMVDEVWTGCNYIETTWDGKVLSAVEMHHNKMKNYKPEYREKHTVGDDWLVATIDYHS